MAQHGYLREYDEAPDRDDDRERGWRSDERDWDERSRRFMFGDRDHGHREHERGLDWSSDRDREFSGGQRSEWNERDRGMSHYGREHGYGGLQGDYRRSGQGQGGFGGRGDWERSPRNFSSHQDDHYRSWRDKQMAALDRDYADYCREREQQFHQDFDQWRSGRQNQSRGSSEDVMELNNPKAQAGEIDSAPSPMAEATLGTNNSENTETGRGRR